MFKQTSFQRKDMFKVNMNKYDGIVVFGVDTLMDQLGAKLMNEVKSDCQVVTCRFPFPNWKPTKVKGEGLDTVWLYDMNDIEIKMSDNETLETLDSSSKNSTPFSHHG